MSLSAFLLTLGPLVASTPAPTTSTPPPAVAPGPLAPVADFDHEHLAWTKVLKANVRGDRFDYAAIQKDPSALDAYIATLNAVTPQQLQSWTEDQRMAFVLREYEGLDYDTIAQVMGVSEGTVKSRIHRAKEALRVRLSPYLRTGS